MVLHRERERERESNKWVECGVLVLGRSPGSKGGTSDYILRARWVVHHLHFRLFSSEIDFRVHFRDHSHLINSYNV